MTKDWGYAALVEVRADIRSPAKDLRRPVSLMWDWERRCARGRLRAPNPTALGNLSEGDLRSYRALLAQSDDLRESGPEVGRFAAVP
jgi:hypothetical protein